MTLVRDAAEIACDRCPLVLPISLHEAENKRVRSGSFTERGWGRVPPERFWTGTGWAIGVPLLDLCPRCLNEWNRRRRVIQGGEGRTMREAWWEMETAAMVPGLDVIGEFGFAPKRQLVASASEPLQ